MSPHRDESDVLLPGLSEKPPAEWTNGSFVVPLAAGYVARGVWIVWGNTSEDNTNLGQRYIAWLRRCDVESATEFPLGITLDEKQIAEAAKLVAVLERIKELCLRIDPSLRQAGPERGTAFAASFYNTFA